ncbi:MAG: beta-propeller fold lactonase family protein [Spirochaetota bacterium]
MYNDTIDDQEAEYQFYLAIVNSMMNYKISIVSIESTTLSKSSQTSTGSTQVDYVAAHPTGNYLYVTNPGSQRILMYKVVTNGTLEVLGTGFINTTDGGGPGGTPGVIKVHPSGNYAFVANAGTSFNISRYLIDSAGTLTFQDYISPGASATSSRMVIDKSATYLYWVSNNAGGNVLQQVEISGSLIIDKTVSYASNTPRDVAVHPNGQYIYVTVDGTIYLYYSNDIPTSHGSIAGDGMLTIHPNGKFLYTDDDSNVKVYQINADGTLTDLNNSTPVQADVKDFIIDTNGNYLIASGRGSDSIEYLKINADGTTSPIQYYDGGFGHYPNALDGYRSSPCGLALINRQKIK